MNRRDLTTAAMAAASLSVCAAVQAQTPAQNSKPERLLDYSWAVNLSKQPASDADCTSDGCLRTDEEFKLIRDDEDPDRILLVIANSNDQIEHLEARLVGRVPSGDLSGGNTSVEIVFDDTIADPANPPRRRMCLHAVHMDGETVAGACKTALGKLSDGKIVDKGDVDRACPSEHLVYWRVSDFPDPCSGPFPEVTIRGNPDTGHGTAGGGN